MKLPCFFVPTDLVVRSVPPSSLFIATKRNVTEHTWADSAKSDWKCRPTESTCVPESKLVGSMYAGFSTFQLFNIKHIVHSGHKFFRGDAQQFPGIFQWPPGVTEVTFGEAETASEALDEGLTLGDLLYLAGENGTWLEPGSLHYQPSFKQRDQGGILAITMRYTNGHNCRNFWCLPGQDDPEWHMSVTKLKDGYEFSEAPQAYGPDVPMTSYSQAYHHHIDSGWLIMTMQEFEVGTFDLATLLLNVTASLALMASISKVLDLLAMYVLPNRKQYRACMVMTTRDFDEMRDKLAKQGTLSCGTSSDCLDADSHRLDNIVESNPTRLSTHSSGNVHPTNRQANSALEDTHHTNGKASAALSKAPSVLSEGSVSDVKPQISVYGVKPQQSVSDVKPQPTGQPETENEELSQTEVDKGMQGKSSV